MACFAEILNSNFLVNICISKVIATTKQVRTLLMAERLEVGAGLQICSITNNNFNKPAPTGTSAAKVNNG